jgi:hypothetical protein
LDRTFFDVLFSLLSTFLNGIRREILPNSVAKDQVITPLGLLKIIIIILTDTDPGSVGSFELYG